MDQLCTRSCTTPCGQTSSPPGRATRPCTAQDPLTISQPGVAIRRLRPDVNICLQMAIMSAATSSPHRVASAVKTLLGPCSLVRKVQAERHIRNVKQTTWPTTCRVRCCIPLLHQQAARRSISPCFAKPSSDQTITSQQQLFTPKSLILLLLWAGFAGMPPKLCRLQSIVDQHALHRAAKSHVQVTS